MPEIQEQMQDYRCPAPPRPRSPAPCGPRAGARLPGARAHCASLLRTRRTLGLGSLYGENDLLQLDGDPGRERQVAEQQLDALGDIL